jgi:hypothetical protein
MLQEQENTFSRLMKELSVMEFVPYMITQTRKSDSIVSSMVVQPLFLVEEDTRMLGLCKMTQN